VPVGKTIAMLAEEGDDISNVEVPAEEEKPSSSSQESQSSEKSASQSSSSSSSSSTSKSEKSPSQATTAAPPKDSESGTSAVHVPHTSKPLMPSVMRLLSDFNVSNKDAESIKGTGVRGMLTKGDVLVYLGKAKTPTGTFKADNFGVSALGGPPSSSPKGDGQTKRSEVSIDPV
jgi:pyruvate/2-oxoglutarate dehydrogenase complex dihydrolipoamide acyltransferase (E2) component